MLKRHLIWLSYSAACALCSLADYLPATPLDDYIKLPDPNYTWSLEQIEELPDVRIFKASLTSQAWRSEKDLSKPLWKHHFRVIVPNKLQTLNALFSITGGSDGMSETLGTHQELPLLEIASRTHSIVCEMDMVPNQPLKFSDEWDARYFEQGRREDALVAYTWDKFLNNQDSSWLLRLPMTKAVVRGMDACQELLRKYLATDLQNFYLIGRSKCAWTAWCAAAVDNRVKGVIPIAIDLLDLKSSFIRQYMAYGHWSFALRDYADIEIPKRWHSPAFKIMMDIIEPSAYFNRFNLSKFLINASGDELFLPDSSRFYFGDLPGQKHLLYLPNTGHKVPASHYLDTLIAYLNSEFQGKNLPTCQWKIEQGNLLKVIPSKKPYHVCLWKAHNTTGRDFRLSTIGSSWTSCSLKSDSNEEYSASLDISKEGWTAYFVEVSFEMARNEIFRVTTDVMILPDDYPYSSP